MLICSRLGAGNNCSLFWDLECDNWWWMVGFSSGDQVGWLSAHLFPEPLEHHCSRSHQRWAWYFHLHVAKINKPSRESTQDQILSWCRPSIKSKDCANTPHRNLPPSASTSQVKWEILWPLNSGLLAKAYLEIWRFFQVMSLDFNFQGWYIVRSLLQPLIL